MEREMERERGMGVGEGGGDGGGEKGGISRGGAHTYRKGDDTYRQAREGLQRGQGQSNPSPGINLD